MDIFPNLDLLSVGMTIAATMVLGFSVYFNDRKSITNKTFFFFSLVTALWGIVTYFSYQFSSIEFVLWLFRFTMFFAVFQSFFLFQFFLIFPQDTYSFSRKYKFILVPLVLVTAGTSLTPLLFPGIIGGVITGEVAVASKGPGLVLFGVVAVGLVLGGLYNLLVKIKRVSTAERSPYSIVLIGTTITFFLIIFFSFITATLYKNPRFVPLGPIFFFPFIAFTSYAILKYKLFNLKVAGTAVLVFILAITTLIELLLSRDLLAILLRIVVFGLVLVFGIFLMRSVLRDIRQREKVEKLFGDLEKNFGQLKEMNASKTEFLSIASHQLRAPLAAIKGFLSMLKEGDFGSVTGEQKNVIDKMTEAEDHVLGLVEDYLNFTRIESGRTQLNLSQVDIKHLISAIVEQLQPLAVQKNIKLLFKDSFEPVVISADGEKLHQVVMNLTENAIKYTDQGEVAVSVTHSPKEIVISVRDTGRGIAPGGREAIFKKFTRGKEAIKDSKGTGLGLYIAQEFVKAHGGRIDVFSEGIGKGSVFSIIIPLPS